jgi:hypothetical protein
MRTSIAITGVLMTAACYAQHVSVPEGYEARENLRELGSLSGTGQVRTFDTRYEGVRGTPYVFEKWLPGEVYLNDKLKVAVKEMNYDCNGNEILFKDPATGVAMLMNRYLVDLFTLFGSKDTMTFVPLKLGQDSEPLFAMLLYNRGSMVYKVFRKEFVKADYEGGYSADRRYDEFVDKYDLYFMKKNDHMLYKVKRSRKYMVASFPGKEAEISAYIKSKRVDLKDENEIVELLQYYDSL